MTNRVGHNVKALVFLFCGLVSTCASASAPATGSLGQAVQVSNATSLEGASKTVLPNGRILLLGGTESGNSSNAAFFLDRRTGVAVAIAKGLLHARSFHSATLLPNGKVFIFGGMGQGDTVQTQAELFDPEVLTFSELLTPGLEPRAHHSATLLTDGSVLLAGGNNPGGKAVSRLDLWNFRTGLTFSLAASLSPARIGDVATLQSDGTVLLKGGIDASGVPLDYGAIVDTDAPSVRYLSKPGVSPTSPIAPALSASIPQNGETGIALDRLLALRFSEPLDVNSLNTTSIALRTFQGSVSINVVPADDGMLAFVIPRVALATSTVYTIAISGALDKSGHELPDTTIVFTTEASVPVNLAGAGTSAAAASGWGTGTGAASANAATTEWRKLPMLPAPEGVTALAGQVLKLDGTPLANVLIEIGSHHANTDDSGRFLVQDVGPGHHVMLVDGGPASGNAKSYGIYRIGVDLKERQTNNLNYTVWMTALDTQHVVKISSPTTADMIVTNPVVPGLELHIPAGTVIHDARGKIVTEIGITPIPTLQPPFPLKRGAVFPVYFTIQPGGASFATTTAIGPTLADPKAASKPRGATIHYENHYGAKAGVRFAFWNYDPAQKGWYVYGHGRVSADSKMIHPEEGTQIYSFDGAMVSLPSNAPPGGPNGGPKDGDPVDLQTGLFVYSKTDLAINDVLPLALTRNYRQADYTSRAFGIGTSMPYDMFLIGDAQTSPEGYTYQDLVLADGGRVHFTRTSPCTGTNGFCDYANALYTATSAPGSFYGATLYYSGGLGGFWTLTSKDGTVYLFPDSEFASIARQAALTGIRDRNGNTVTFTRDGNSNLTKIASPNGRWIQLTYDGSNRVIQASDNIGRTCSYIYTPAGYLWTATDPKGGVSTYTYDTSGNMLTIADARGIIYLQNQYDVNDMVSQQTQADGSVYQFAYSLDSNSNVVQTNVTDPRGYLRTVVFNSDGYMTSDTHAVGALEHQAMTYNLQQGTGLLLSKTDALNRTTAYSYDALANTTSVTSLAGTANAVTTSLSYIQPFSKLETVTDPLGHTSSFTYDNSGNPLTAADPLGNSSTYAYNSAGQPTMITDPLGNQKQLGYQSGIINSVKDPLGRTFSWFIDAAGRQSAKTDPLGNTVRYTFDPSNDVTTITDPLGTQTVISYDPNGNQLTVTDANQHTTTNVYDVMDHVSTSKDALGLQNSAVHDLSGNLIQFTDRKSQLTTYAYDGLNRVTFIGYGTQAGPVYQSTVNYTYDAGNRLTAVADTISGSMSRTYDGLDRALTETTPQGRVTYTYDADERRSTMTVTGQPVVTYGYDAGSRLNLITQGATAISFAYDALGRRTTLVLPNGVAANYSYDAASQLTGIFYQGGAMIPGNLAYSYDMAGRRSGVSGSLASTQLPAAVVSAAYNANNQLTQWGPTAPTYDANGSTLNDGMNSYAWDARNRMVSANSATSSFTYDPLGRRVQKTTPAGSTGFLYDGVNVVQELAGATPSANLLTGGVDERFSRTDALGPMSFVTDALGSTVALADSTGTTQAQYSYDPYGNINASGTFSTNSYAYTGREADGLGIYYNRARYYNPVTDRFLSEDPIGSAGGINHYAYAADSPTNLTDPSGEVAIYGNYCGPDWTGARVEPYDPSHDVPFTYVASMTYTGYIQTGVGIVPTPYYAPPVDKLDASCETHDKCYYSCRSNNKCDKAARASCMKQCNRALQQGASHSGVSGWSEVIELGMIPAPTAGENDLSCRKSN